MMPRTCALTPRQAEILEALDRFQAEGISKTDEEILREANNLDIKYGNDPTYVQNIDGVLTNIGSSKRSTCVLLHARKRLLNILSMTKEDFPRYNLGNALLAIADIKCANSLEELLASSEYREAREHFAAVPRGPSYARANTNRANILEKYGRSYEAIHAYDKVLKQKPNFGMALGNKAIALSFYYSLVSDKSHNLLRQASELLKKAIKEENTAEEGGQGAIEHFKSELKKIEEHLNRYHLKEPSSKQSYNRITKYQSFCRDKDLYLNTCFNCFRCKRGLMDSLSFHFIDSFKAASGEDDHSYSSYTNKTYLSIKTLNQIYEDYATARYLYYQAATRKFSSYDKITQYSCALDYCCNSLRYGLVKTSYIRLFNIMDKIAHLVYTNYGLAHKKLYIDDLRSPSMVDIIKRERSWGLLALHNMAGDFLEGRIYGRYSQVRHIITHEFIDIGLLERPFKDETDQYFNNHHLSEELLHSYTEDLFLLVKSALIYFMNALFQDYLKRRKQGEPLTLPIYPQRRFYN